MTYEEAIKVIESNKPTSGYMMLCEALDIAKEAIEKQIPKKPIRYAKEVVCPTCKTLTDRRPYCASCGQSLDWHTYEEEYGR